VTAPTIDFSARLLGRFEPDSVAWHEARHGGLGGSDMAAVCGLDKWKSPLEVWYEKTGCPVARRDDPVLDEAALMGHILEPIAAQRFTDITGLPAFEGPGTLQSVTHPWMLANLDRVTEDGGLPGVVEAKSRSSYALPEWLDGVPMGPMIQVQHYLAVTGWSFGYAVALIGGQRTIVHRVERDDALITDLIKIGEDFMRYVHTDTPPPVDGSDATGKLLDRLHTDLVTDPLVADASEVEKWLKIRRSAKEHAEAAEIAITEADNHLKDIAGPHTEIHIRGELAYSWRPKRGQVSWKKAALDADPELDPEPYRGKPSRTLTVHLENL
jgi:putative phage-type endonuclease